MERAEVVSECTCVDPKPVEINVLNKYVELPKDDVQHKVHSLIKVRGKNKSGTKTRAPANKSILNIVVNTPGVSL